MDQQQNPYMAMINRLRQTAGNSQAAPGANPAQMVNALGAQAGANRTPGTVPNGAGPAGANAQQAGQQGPAGPGDQPGNTKMLMSAIQALHQFTQAGTDPQEIAVVRSMIVILSQLIQRDQAMQAQGGQGGQPQTPSMPGATTPPTPPTGGAPMGPIAGAAPGGPQVGGQFGQAP